ncbi:MAG: hypothetical protein MZU91_12200 [Desulfosudis oleivorans]|nr:hypothetical protein [Desulfosudis oleivorans]
MKSSGELELSLVDVPAPGARARRSADPRRGDPDQSVRPGTAVRRAPTWRPHGSPARPSARGDGERPGRAHEGAWRAAWTSRCRSATKARAWWSRPARSPPAQATARQDRGRARRRHVLAVPQRQGSCNACCCCRPGTTPAEGASCFVNPLTALGMVETMRREGHTALVHTAAASSPGQMLNRLCLEDQVGLVNIVRNPSSRSRCCAGRVRSKVLKKVSVSLC